MTVTLLTTREVVDDVRRREFLGILAAAGLLAGCGADDTTSAEPGGTRRVTDDLGRDVDVPQQPRRIATIDPLYTTAQLVDLGLPPLASSVNTSTPVELMPAALGAAVDDAEPLGAIGSVEVESLAAQRPDLILFNLPYQEELDAEVLQRVAPTIAYELLDSDDANLRRLAGWVGREEQAEQVIADWEETLAGLAAELDLRGRTFSLVLAYPDASAFNVDSAKFSLGKLVTALGGRVVPTEVDGEPIGDGLFGISLEVLPEAVEADTILLQRYNAAESDDAVADLLDTPLWQSIGAVQRGDVIVLDVQGTTASYGYAGLEAVARQIAAEV